MVVAIIDKWTIGMKSYDPKTYILTFVVLIFFSYLPKLFRPLKGKKIPNVQGGFPFFGQVFEMIQGSPWDTMANWVTTYGGIYKFLMFGSEAIVIADPNLLQVVLNTKLSLFHKDLEWTYKPFLVILGNGIVTAHNDDWRRQRHLLSKHFRVDILELIPDMALRAVHRFFLKLDKVKKDGSIIDLADEFRHLTLQVISEAVLSISPEESDQTFALMYLPIVEEGNNRTWDPTRTYLPTPAWFKFRTDVKKLNDYVERLISTRWNLRLKESTASQPSTRKLDLLDKCLSAIPPADWSQHWLIQVRDEVKTFILAGHETSASMLTWSVYEITKNPSLAKRIREEAKAVYGSHLKFLNNENGQHPTASTIGSGLTEGRGGNIQITSLPSRVDISSGLVLAEACLRESLRKYSNVPTVVRVATEDVDVGDYHIPKGSTVMVSMQGVHHSPLYWKDPLTYDPDRFFGEIQPYTFLPFAEGPRMCLGQFLSLLESKIVLSLLLTAYEFEVVNVDEAGLKHPFMVPIIPKNGHKMRVK